MSGVTLTSSTTVVTLEIVSRIDETLSRNVNVYTFGDGTETMLDEGKANHNITLVGVDKGTIAMGVEFPLTFPIMFPADSTPITRMQTINQMMDDQEEVILSGLIDTYLNTDYRIIDFSFDQGAGEGAVPLYHYSITLERIRDRLG